MRPPKALKSGASSVVCVRSSRWFSSRVCRLVRSVKPLMSVKTMARLAVFKAGAVYAVAHGAQSGSRLERFACRPATDAGGASSSWAAGGSRLDLRSFAGELGASGALVELRQPAQHQGVARLGLQERLQLPLGVRHPALLLEDLGELQAHLHPLGAGAAEEAVVQLGLAASRPGQARGRRAGSGRPRRLRGSSTPARTHGQRAGLPPLLPEQPPQVVDAGGWSGAERAGHVQVGLDASQVGCPT